MPSADGVEKIKDQRSHLSNSLAAGLPSPLISSAEAWILKGAREKYVHESVKSMLIRVHHAGNFEYVKVQNIYINKENPRIETYTASKAYTAHVYSVFESVPSFSLSLSFSLSQPVSL